MSAISGGSIGVVLSVVLTLALGGCATGGVLRDFTSDGCSLYPEGDAAQPQRWLACCTDHDRAYWLGGTATQRLQADRKLRDCVARSGRPGLAALMYRGVRLGGSPFLPTGFRWGYGWAFGRGYAPLSTGERRQADPPLACAAD